MAIKLPRMFSKFKHKNERPVSPEVRLAEDIARLKQTALFDPAFYLATYPDVAASGIAPELHFAAHGAEERRKPCRHFDTAYYAANNPDVIEAGMNPLLHFAAHGWREFRQPSPSFDGRRYFLLHLAPIEQALNPLEHFMLHGQKAGLSAPSVEGTTAGELRRMRDAAMELVAPSKIDELEADFLKVFARACLASGFWEPARSAFERIATVEPDIAGIHAELASLHARDEDWGGVEVCMQRAVELDESRLDWLESLAAAQERMGHFAAAERTLRKLLEHCEQDPGILYRVGFALERQGELEQANEAYASALAVTTDKAAKKWGVGVFHQEHERWVEARDAYKAQVDMRPYDAELRYRLAWVHDRLYEWEAAEKYYAEAVGLSWRGRPADWCYRLGYTRERLGRYAEAAEAYRAAIERGARSLRYCFYRLGYVLEAAGEKERACEAYSQMWELGGASVSREAEYTTEIAMGEAIADQQANESTPVWERDDCVKRHGVFKRFADAIRMNPTDAGLYFKFGQGLDLAGETGAAIDAYQAALARSDQHRPKWYFSLGRLLFAAGRLDEACEAFRQTRVLQRPHGEPEEKWRRNRADWQELSYLEYRECLPLRDNVILYESFGGRSFSCNPLAIFKELVGDPDFAHFLHVCVLNDKAEISDDLLRQDNVVFVSKESDGYLRHLATAKYLVNNTGFGSYFIRRPGQKYLETWHGTPLKTLGKEQKYKFYDHRRTERNLLQASHIVTPNPHTTKTLLDSYDVRQLATAKVAEIGYPRVAMMLNADEERKQYLRERMGLSSDKPIVLYAPTWRGTPDDATLDTAQLQHDLAMLSRQHCQLIFRGHNFLEEQLALTLQDKNLDCVIAPGDIDTNDMLSIIDVLITDYSSVFFDFLPLGRPVLFYTHDLEEYERDRGLYFSMDEMPGRKCRTIDDLCEALGEAITQGVDDTAALARARETFCPHDDGQATKRTIAFFFKEDDRHSLDYRVEGRPSVLISGGSFALGDTTDALISVFNKLDRTSTDVAICFSPDLIEILPDNVAQFRRLPEDILAVPLDGRMLLSLDERWVLDLCRAGLPLSSAAQRILKAAYTREFVRILGARTFDVAVSFDANDVFWTSLMLANGRTARKIVYLHEDAGVEFETLESRLAGVFRLLPMADKIVLASGIASQDSLSEFVFECPQDLASPIADAIAKLDRAKDQ